MIDVSKLNPRYIQSNGRYVDVSNSFITTLTYEEVEMARQYFKDYTIGMEVVNPNVRVKNTNMRSTSERRKVHLVREQKYNNGNYRGKSGTSFIGKKVLIGALLVCVCLGFYKINSSSAELEQEVIPFPDMSMEDVIIVSEDYDPIGTSTYEAEAYLKDNINISNVATSSPILDEREQTIMNFCNIYQVNYDKVYPFLVDITNNFSSENYLNNYIPGVTCKGVEVVANSEDELLLYAIRCIKQIPGQLGMESDGLYVSNGYNSGTNYCGQIGYVADLLGVDKCLMYAVVQSECCFDSDLFNGCNNPAGLKNESGEWWIFDTKEEGFFELGMELLKYYRKIGVSPTEVTDDIIRQIRDIHSPLSDNNDNWLPNVLSNYEYAKLHEGELFGTIGEMNYLNK